MPRREPGLVNAVVHVVVKKICKLGVFVFDFFRKKIDTFIFRDRIECIVEHPADIVLAVIDDLFRLLVPQHRYCDAAIEIRIGRRVRFAQVVEGVYRIS